MPDGQPDAYTHTTSAVHVREARWPGDLPVVRDLFCRYFDSLRTDPLVPSTIRARDRTSELSGLPAPFDGISAVLLLAVAGDQVCGCASIQPLPAGVREVELKRLFVLPEARGRGVGRALIEACAVWARGRGARELLLDTLPGAMPEAVRLYQALGFQPTERYNENEGPEFAFFRLDLG